VGDALEAWLEHGTDGLSERTVTLYRGTIVKALNEELDGARLMALTASDVQKGLTALAARSSTRTVQIAHNVLVRAIRHAERDDLVGRNVAALVDTPKGQLEGRPSKSLTLEQTMALMAAAKLRWDHIVAWVDEQWQPAGEAGFDQRISKISPVSLTTTTLTDGTRLLASGASGSL
jgi:hypothetical protein